MKQEFSLKKNINYGQHTSWAPYCNHRQNTWLQPIQVDNSAVGAQKSMWGKLYIWQLTIQGSLGHFSVWQAVHDSYNIPYLYMTSTPGYEKPTPSYDYTTHTHLRISQHMRLQHKYIHNCNQYYLQHVYTFICKWAQYTWNIPHILW